MLGRQTRFQGIYLFLGVYLLLEGFADAANPYQTTFKASSVSATPQVEDTWDFNEAPSVSATHNLVFDTASSLMQHWPNTRYRNGHNIVPATMPVGTLLYHGTSRNKIPEIPEWTATDPEHSYLFCRTLKKGSGCWHLTLVTTRPLRLLYFDGSSAAKMRGGPMHSQDIVIWGEVKPEKTGREQERIEQLCNWGKQHQLDGFVRSVDTEVMLCDFTEGVKTVSFLNLADPRREPPRPPPHVPEAFPANDTNFTENRFAAGGAEPGGPGFRVIESGSWHNHFPGDTRIKLDYSRLISFYDTKMFPSLVASRFDQSRLNHNLAALSTADAQSFASQLAKVLRTDSEFRQVSVDWQSLFKIIHNRYAERLELLHYTLNATITSDDHATAILEKAHQQITGMIIPYIIHSAVPPKITAAPSDYSWATPIFELCTTTHISHLETEPTVFNALTSSERLLLDSIKGVSKEICRVVVGLWAEGKERTAIHETHESKHLAQKWLKKVKKLMTWLDWTLWLRCRPACSYEEFCYLPTWPFFFPGGKPRGPAPEQPGHRDVAVGKAWNEDLEEEEWIDPKPMCIRRM
ncbi:hypothetical protein CPC08DRAFT_638474 [Agrocybe pediades]|nr:hypothetical protein CPC08DRAFT_638474 [Agrocybe pediades]